MECSPQYSMDGFKIVAGTGTLCYNIIETGQGRLQFENSRFV